jgi:hypothetical protein
MVKYFDHFIKDTVWCTELHITSKFISGLSIHMFRTYSLDIDSVVELDNFPFSEHNRSVSRAQPPSWAYFFRVKVNE